MIQMARKCFFFLKNEKYRSAYVCFFHTFVPDIPELQQFARQAAKLRRFSRKKRSLLVSSPTSETKS